MIFISEVVILKSQSKSAVYDKPVSDAQATRSISYFVSKDAMNIVGFGKSKVEALMGSGYIKDVSDMGQMLHFE